MLRQVAALRLDQGYLYSRPLKERHEICAIFVGLNTDAVKGQKVHSKNTWTAQVPYHQKWPFELSTASLNYKLQWISLAKNGDQASLCSTDAILAWVKLKIECFCKLFRNKASATASSIVKHLCTNSRFLLGASQNTGMHAFAPSYHAVNNIFVHILSCHQVNIHHLGFLLVCVRICFCPGVSIKVISCNCRNN